MATLRVYRGDQFVAPFELGDGRVRIGRGTENQLVLEDRDKQVSRTHAEIRFERGHYLITDLNSQNGVWIGERQIKSEEALPANVPVTIGPYRLILVAEEPARAAVPADSELLDPAGAEPYIEPTMLDEMPAAAPPPVRSTPAPPPPPVPAPPVAAAPARTQTGKTAAPKPAKSNLPLLVGAVVAVAILAALAVVFLRRTKPAEEVVAVQSSSSSSSTTTTVPATPTPEEVFLEHYNKAQALIGENNKNAARDENTAALAALPNDQRGLDQLKAIDALVDPNAPPVPAAAPAGPPNPVVPAGPEWLRVAARPGEPERERANREKTARGHLDEGRKALTERRFDAAVTALQAALATSGRQDFGAVANETTSLLARAKKEQGAAIAAARNAAAQRALADARTLATSDIPAAMQKLREARGLDPELEGVTELQTTLQEQARSQGESALGRAKNFDNRNRTEDALREYERAVQLLELVPGGHKELPLARQRVAALKQ